MVGLRPLNTIRERIRADGSDGVRDVDVSEAGAASKRSVADGSDGVGRAVVSDCGGDGYRAGVFIRIGVIILSFECDGGGGAVDFVVDAVDFEVVGVGEDWQ